MLWRVGLVQDVLCGGSLPLATPTPPTTITSCNGNPTPYQTVKAIGVLLQLFLYIFVEYKPRRPTKR